MKYFFIVLLFSTLFTAQADTLDSLLDNYEANQELYHKTKQESAGHIIIYSRRDLDRMQAYTLKDVLKIIPMFTLQTSRLGLSNLIRAGTPPVVATPVKLYIDDHEYSSDLRPNIIFRYGEMNLYFVDHIEVYQGGTSLSFGNEIGSMTIRIYTKKAARENATSLQESVDNYKSNSLSVLSANETKYFDYLAYVSNSKKNYQTYTNKYGNKLSKNGKQQQVHLKFYKEKNFSLDFDLIQYKTDPFIGFGQKPLSGTLSQFYALIGFTKYFPYGCKLIISHTIDNASPNEYDDNSIHLEDNSIISHLDIKLKSSSNKIQIEKKTVLSKHDLLIGLQIFDKHAHVKKYQANSINKIVPNTPKKMDIGMIYAEDSYNFNERNLLALSAKVDYYMIEKRKNSTQYSIRLAYVGMSNNNKATLKVFALRRYIAPCFTELSFAPTYHANPNLTTIKVKSLTSELIYKIDEKNILDMSYGKLWIQDPIVFSPQQVQYINKKTSTNFERYYVRYKYKFNYNHKLKLEYFQGYSKHNFSPDKGALFELFDTFGRFDIYNQLAYRSSYTFHGFSVANGYDYTIAVGYKYNHNLNLKFKGENLLDNYSKTLFPTQGIAIPGIDKRVIATMEYTF